MAPTKNELDYLEKTISEDDRTINHLRSKIGRTNDLFRVSDLVKMSDDPYQTCVAVFARREESRTDRTKTFYFDDGSFLVFKVSYDVIESRSLN